MNATRRRHVETRREIPAEVFFASLVGAVFTGLLSVLLPGWLRGSSPMPYRISATGRWLFLSLGAATVASALVGRSNAAAFGMPMQWITFAGVAVTAWLVFALYWWRWRGAASSASGTPPYR